MTSSAFSEPGDLGQVSELASISFEVVAMGRYPIKVCGSNFRELSHQCRSERGDNVALAESPVGAVLSLNSAQHSELTSRQEKT
jgi:hypothetical protein